MTQLVRALLAALIGLLLGSATPMAPFAAPPPLVAPSYMYDGHYDVAMTHTTSERGPPATYIRNTAHFADGRWSHGPSSRPDGTTPAIAWAYDHPALLVQVASASGTTRPGADCDVGDLSSLSGARVAANAERGVLRSVDDVMADGGTLLRGKSPAEVESILKDTPGWRVEGLGRGSAQGRGWIMREYTERGNPTGRMIRWHPGGGRHGPDPYWRVVGYEGDLLGIIR